MNCIKTLISFILFFSLLIYSLSAAVFDVDTLLYSGDINNRVNIVILGDGYDSTQQADLLADVNNLKTKFFNWSPFKEYQNFFNLFVVKIISIDTSAKHPNTASDCPSGGSYIPTADPNNYLGSTFDRGGTHRCLYVTNWTNYYNTLADNFPLYDAVYVLVNSPYWGGCGGVVGVGSAHTNMHQLMIHELGHSYGGLGDEYDYGNCSGGEGVNYTQETDSSLVKWNKWFSPGTPIPTPSGTLCSQIGLYEGAHYCPTGSYRPKCNCTMKNSSQPFCQVCKEHLIYVTHNYINLIDSFTVLQDTTYFCDNTSQQIFSASIVTNDPNTIKSEWLLNNVSMAVNTSSYTLHSDSLIPGINKLTLKAIDTTSSIKDTFPYSTNTWYIKLIDTTVTPLPQPTFPPLGNTCINTAPFSLSGGMPAGGTYFGPGVNEGNFDPAAAGLGSHTISYIYTICNINDTVNSTITVNAPSTTVTLAPFDSVCASSSGIILTGGSPLGGVYSGTGVFSGTFYPTTAGIGTHTITYTYTDTFGCSISDNETIKVFPSTPMSFTLQDSICINENPLTLTGGSPPGGSYSGTGVSGGIFYPAVAGVGSYWLQYSYSDTLGCQGNLWKNITVTSAPTSTFATIADLCIDDPPYTLTEGSPAGGVYIGTGVFSGVFYPDSAGAGTHIISYILSDTLGCTDTSTSSINVIPSAVTFPTSDTVCEHKAPYVLSGGLPAGGTYFGAGVIANTFYPDSAGPGTHPISYFYGSCSDTAVSMFKVVPQALVTISPYNDICLNDTPIVLTEGHPTGGTYSGDGVAGGVFYPAVAGIGTHSIIYNYIDTNGCSGSANTSIKVLSLPFVTFTAVDSICVNDPAIDLIGGLPAGGSYSGAGVSGHSFDPSIAGIGSHLITYIYTDSNGCSDSAFNKIEVISCTIEYINSINSNFNVEVFPNPFFQETMIKYQLQTTRTVTIAVYDLLGNEVEIIVNKEIQDSGEQDYVWFCNNPGIYFLRIIVDQQCNIIKLIVLD